MDDGATIIVYRGAAIPLRTVHDIVRELLGGHLRPDADLAVHCSAPVRVDRLARSRSSDPLAGTIRTIHLAVSASDGILTELSKLILGSRLGFPKDLVEQGWREFGHIPSDAVALAISELTGPVATLSLCGDSKPMGAYSVFSTGRRIWSSCYRPEHSYATWDGENIHVQSADKSSPLPPEGDTTAFPAHGLQLLFPEDLALREPEKLKLLPSLLLASRPPSTDAEGRLLVSEGCFLQPTPLGEADWLRFQHSFSC